MARRCTVLQKGVQSGNNVSHSNRKTRRRFLPNLQISSFTSEILGRTVRLRVSVHGIRSIEHNGGIDAFLLKARASELSPDALKVRRMIERHQQKTAQA